MKCCRSCVYWDKASRKVPIDVYKVINRNEKIIVEFRGKKAEIYGWKWVPKDPSKLSMAIYSRVCFYGKGIILPWDECEYYEAKYPGKLFCDVSKCEFENICPKFRESKIPYIS